MLSTNCFRYRVRLSRLGPARDLTHLAQIEALRRAVLASGLPAAMDGRRKRARPKLAFGPAVSVGYESLAEYFDMELAAPVAPAQIAEAFGKVLEPGFSVRQVRRIPAFFPSLDASINVVRYEVTGPFPPGAAESLREFLARKEIVIEKLKQGGALVERVDARHLIIDMSLAARDRLNLTLRFGPKRTVKPEALIREWLKLPAPVGRVPTTSGGGIPTPGTRGYGAVGAGPELKSALEGYLILRKDLLSETSRGELLVP